MENIVETLIYALLVILTLAGMWKTYEKAGEAGWKAIIPIYNLIIFARIVKKPWWWALLMLIPYLGIIWSVWATNLLAKSFGKGVLYTIGLILLPFIFYPIVGYGDAKYVGLDSAEPIDTSGEDIEDDISEAATNMYESTQDTVSEGADRAADYLNEEEEEK